MFTQDIKKQNPLKKCPYCKGTSIIKKGFRKKKHEEVQLYYCKDCNKKFTPRIHKYKTFPLHVIIDSLTTYNQLYNLSETEKIITERYGIKVNSQNIKNWLDDFKEYLPFLRMREFVLKNYKRKEAFVESRMFHGQIYDYKYHRAKTDLIIEDDFKHYKFKPLQKFLELVVAECPHNTFKESTLRASDQKDVFDLEQVKINKKNNLAIKMARLVTQAINNNKLRHEVLEKYMFNNDTVTVAVEVPILLTFDNFLHYTQVLGFKAPLNIQEDDVLTGHIDMLQIRNGCIHILDYKPSARKEKPVDQLMVYALALSRLTGIRLYHFKCGWFDRNDYYEFFPLHVVHKKKIK